MTERKNRSNLTQRMLCAVLAIVMVLSLAACGTGAATESTGALQTTAPSTQPSTAPTQPSTAPTQPSTEATEPSTEATDPSADPTQPSTSPSEPDETVPTVPSETVQTVPLCDLEYTLTQADVDEYYRLLGECETLSLAGVDMDAIDASVVALEEQYQYLDAQCSIATIFHYSNTADKALEAQYLNTVDICTAAHDAYIQMVRRIYLSDTPAKESLFEDWTDAEIKSLLNYNEEIALLQQRNAEIGVEYRATDNDARKIELYIEFVQNNNKIAKFYEYDNYYTYAYELVYERDYDTQALENLRLYAKTYLKESFDLTLQNFGKSFYSLDYMKQLQVQNVLYASYDKVGTDYVKMYIDAAPENLAAALNSMLKNDSLFTNGADAKAGAFTTAVGDRSYCYFGPGYWSSSTVLHEGGHYYASLYSDLGSIPLDLAEVHSQANEWLFTSFLGNKLDADVHRALVDYKLYEVAAMSIICLMVDEFEQKVYTTDLTGFTAADFDAIMKDIAKQYFPNGDVAVMLADMNAYWRMVVVDQPVYYISYAVSGIAAVSLFTAAQKDYNSAMASYQKLCEAPVLESGFLGNIRDAGLATPFDEQFYLDFKAMIIARGQ